MAIRTKMTDEQMLSFERELRSVLVRDPEHRFCFDGRLRFFSSRHECLLDAVDVHLDPGSNELVLVGAFRSGRLPVDESRGFPQFVPELSIPFREVFRDMKAAPGFEEIHLVSKARRAVMKKCILDPMGLVSADRITYDRSDGTSRLELVELGSVVNVRDGSSRIGSVTVRDGQIDLKSSEQEPFSVASMTLPEIFRIGQEISAIHSTFQQARKVYLDEVRSHAPDGRTVSEQEVKEGERRGLLTLYEQKFPKRISRAVARSFSKSFADAFDRSASEIDRLMDAFRKGKDVEKGLHPGF